VRAAQLQIIAWGCLQRTAAATALVGCWQWP
jgi:hypothetical protein